MNPKMSTESCMEGSLIGSNKWLPWIVHLILGTLWWPLPRPREEQELTGTREPYLYSNLMKNSWRVLPSLLITRGTRVVSKSFIISDAPIRMARKILQLTSIVRAVLQVPYFNRKNKMIKTQNGLISEETCSASILTSKIRLILMLNWETGILVQEITESRQWRYSRKSLSVASTCVCSSGSTRSVRACRLLKLNYSTRNLKGWWCRQ